MSRNSASVTRHRRTNAELAAVDATIVRILEGDHPQSVRHVFYRCTDPRLPGAVAKDDNGYRAVQRRLSALRQNKTIPYGWVSDFTRRGYHTNVYRSPGEFIRAMAALYRRDMWTRASSLVEVWVESRSLAGVVQRDCAELGVSLYPAGGFASTSLCYQAATSIEAWARDRPVVIFYIGDHDPAGHLIDADIERKLRKFLPDGFPLDFHRLAINADQIAEYDLPTKPRKKLDRRRPDIAVTVEAEAMPASDMRGILRKAVEAHLPPGALAAAKVAEDSEREGLRQLGMDVDENGLEDYI